MRKIQKEFKPYIKKIADKYNLPEEKIMELEYFMWKFVRDVMSEQKNSMEDFKNIYLRYLGTIYFSENKYNGIQKVMERKIKKDVKSTRDI